MKDWYRITNTAGAPARVDIYAEIGGGPFQDGVSAAEFVADLAAIKGDLDVHINSPGGNVFDGLAIYNAIANRPGKVTTHVDGLAASAASFIAQAGKTRIISPGAMLMIHDAQGLSMGNAGDMREMAGLLDKASDNLASVYAAHSGQPAAGWREAMKAESWYTAGEAVAAGLADKLAERPADDATVKVAAKSAVRVWAKVPGWVRAAAAEPWDPDGDGDDDSTPEGDTDHDYWDEDGNQLKPVPGKPMTSLTEAQVRVIVRELINAGKYSADDRKRMAGKEAMGDGSYPIADAEDLDNAIHAVGRGGADHDAIRRHIMQRAKALGLSSKIPDNWNADGSLSGGGTDNHAGQMPAWLTKALTAKEAASR